MDMGKTAYNIAKNTYKYMRNLHIQQDVVHNTNSKI